MNVQSLVSPCCPGRSAEQRARAHHWLFLPEGIQAGAEQAQGSTSRALRMFRQNVPHKSSVFIAFASAQRGLLDPVAARQRTQDLNGDEASEEMEIDLVGKAMGEDLVDIGGDVICCRSRQRCGRGQCERERKDAAFIGSEDERAFHHGPCS